MGYYLSALERTVLAKDFVDFLIGPQQYLVQYTALLAAPGAYSPAEKAYGVLCWHDPHGEHATCIADLERIDSLFPQNSIGDILRCVTAQLVRETDPRPLKDDKQ